MDVEVAVPVTGTTDLTETGCHRVTRWQFGEASRAGSLVVNVRDGGPHGEVRATVKLEPGMRVSKDYPMLMLLGHGAYIEATGDGELDGTLYELRSAPRSATVAARAA